MTTSMTYADHMEVGVRELKAKLSEYLARVAAGEVITVTDRGRPTAILSPVPGAALTRGVEEGWITPPTTTVLRPVRRQVGSSPSAELLDDDRGH